MKTSSMKKQFLKQLREYIDSTDFDLEFIFENEKSEVKHLEFELKDFLFNIEVEVSATFSYSGDGWNEPRELDAEFQSMYIIEMELYDKEGGELYFKTDHTILKKFECNNIGIDDKDMQHIENKIELLIKKFVI